MLATALAVFSLALVSQAPDPLDQIAVLQKLDAAKIKEHQMGRFLASAQAIAAAKAEAEKQLVSLLPAEANLAPVIEALAAGRALTPEEQALWASAQNKRRGIANSLQAKINTQVAAAVAVLDDTQKYELSTPTEIRYMAEARVAEFLASSGDRAERLAQQLVIQLLIKEYPQGKFGSGRSSNRAAEDPKIAQAWRNQYNFLDQVKRQPDRREELVKRLAKASINDNQANQTLKTAIEGILTAPGAVPALHAKVGGKR